MGLVGNIVNNSGVLKNAAPLMLDKVGGNVMNKSITNVIQRLPITPATKFVVPVSPALRNVASNAVRNSLFGKGSFESSNANLNSIRSNIAKANGATEGTAAYKGNLGNAQRYLDAAANSTGQTRTNNMAMARKELETAHSIMTPKIVSGPFNRVLLR